MAENKSKSKNAEKNSSTLATTSEKATKTTAKKVDNSTAKSDATTKKTTANKATSEKTSTAKSSSTKTATPKAEVKPETKKTASATKSSSTKTSAETKSTAAKSDVKKATTKTTAKPDTKASSTKVKEAKDTTTTATKNKVNNVVESKTTDKKVPAKKSAAKEEPKVETPAKTSSQSAKKTPIQNQNNVTAYTNFDNEQKKTTTKNNSTTTAKTTNKKTETEPIKKSASKNAKAEVLATEKPASENNDTNSKAKSKVNVASILASFKKSETKTEDNSKKETKSNADNKMSFKDKMVAFINGSDNNDNNKSKISTKSDNKKTPLSVKAIFTDKKLRIYAIAAIALLLIFILILTISVSAVAANKDKLPGGIAYNVKDTSLAKGSTYDYEYRTTAVAGYNATILGNVKRNIPTETDTLLGKESEFDNSDPKAPNDFVKDAKYYPKYGYTPQGMGDSAIRKQLINEAWKLCSINTRIGSDGYPRNTYNKMKKDGTLWMVDSAGNETPGKPSKLFKHVSAEGMYFGDVSPDEKAVIKEMTFNPRSFHSHGMYSVTGLYAPAGEVLKVQLSEKDMDATGGITIHIGQALYNSKANNIWVAKGQMQRFPVILNTMVVNKNTATLENGVWTAYVGSFLGGPVYVRNAGATFTTTISGGVTYSHFILGHTTPEEFEANKDSSAPYFDLEVWDNGVLHSGPKIYAQNFSYDDLFKVAVLWDQITSVTTTGNNQNIVFIYDPFVAAGAAVAFPSQQAVNCPASWMANSLNYETLIKSGGWGNLHEYHHNFQGYGVGNGGEVTNNALTLVSYALFTKISASRQIGNYGAAGLGGWNNYTSATWALNDILKLTKGQNPSNGAQGLALYATLLHNFGADAFIQVRKLGGGQSYQNYFKKWEQITHNNMTYYFTEILKANNYNANLTDEWLKANSNPDYPMFVPVASVYQTGRSYSYDEQNQYINTMQPYVIPYGQKFTIDLSKYTLNEDGAYKSGSIVLPDGFSYKIKNVSQPENGTITKQSDYIYTLTPNNYAVTGQILVTIELTKNDNEFKVQDFDLILEFEQSHELTGRMLERTTYEFDNNHEYNAVSAFENNYKGYSNKIEGDNKNPTQNSNTDIWLSTDELNNALKHNSIMEVKGKFYITETAKYRFAIRGRHDVALFLSFDEGLTYKLGEKEYAHYVTKGNGTAFPLVEGTYVDTTEKLLANTWVYFKAVMIVDNSNRASFIGVGTGKIPDPLPQTDSEGNPILGDDGNPLPDIPAGDSRNPITVSYASAYRLSYQFAENRFKPDYFYTKVYYQSYSDNEIIITTKQTVINDYGYVPFNNNFEIGNICDGDLNTNINTKAITISEENPFQLEFKFDAPITANKFRIHYSKNHNQAFIGSRPKNYKLYIKSNVNDEWKQVLDIKNAICADYIHTAKFDDFYTFQYYKFVVTDTYYQTSSNPRFMVIHDLQFISQLELSNGSRTSIGDKKIKLYGTWSIEKTPSKFGRVYVGKENSSIQFEFTGTRLILFSVTNFKTNYEVYIDGKKVNSINIKESNEICKETFISPEFNNKRHSVTIKCLGEANFESIVIL